MFATKRTRVIVLAVICFTLLTASTEAKRRKKSAKAGILRQKETNVINFVRLVAMRLIYGSAVSMGLGEQISDALNGAFVPPGVDDYDDYGSDGGLFTRDDDDDDDDYDY